MGAVLSPILLMVKLKHEEMKQRALGHAAAHKWQTQNLHLDSLALGPVLMIVMLSYPGRSLAS